LLKPYRPQTSGMVERFHGRISEMLKQTKFTSSSELKQARYLRLDSHRIPQSSLGYLTPIEALKKWQKSHPHLFKKSVYNETKPDSKMKIATSPNRCIFDFANASSKFLATLGTSDIFGTLAEIPHVAFGIFKNMREIILRR